MTPCRTVGPNGCRNAPSAVIVSSGRMSVTPGDHPHLEELRTPTANDPTNDVVLVGDAPAAVQNAQPGELVLRLLLDRRRDADADAALEKGRDRTLDPGEVLRATERVVAVGLVGVEGDLQCDVEVGERLDPRRGCAR